MWLSWEGYLFVRIRVGVSGNKAHYFFAFTTHKGEMRGTEREKDAIAISEACFPAPPPVRLVA